MILPVIILPFYLAPKAQINSIPLWQFALLDMTFLQ